MTPAKVGGWHSEVFEASPAELHQRDPGAFDQRTVWQNRPTSAAVVLGSAQPEASIDGDVAAAMGLDIVRRRSGGGAVLVEPDDLIWIDLLVPARDPLWHDDVGRSFAWLGQTWARAFESVGLSPHVHEGAMVRNELSRVVCFAGVGPGEVLIDGAKVVGLSQRRTRDGARFQCALINHWRPERMVQLLASPPESAARLLADCARGLDSRGLIARVVETFIAELNRA